MLTHRGTQTIQTPRLVLRRAQREDARAMFTNWASDPEVTKFLTWPAHSSVDVTKMVLESWMEGYEKENYYQWMIVPRDLGEPIGSISVVSLDERAEKAEIGYCMGRAWWHRGIMTEALSAVTEFLFAQVGIGRVEAKHDINNPHSGGVMRKCGMRFECTARKFGRNNQGICDVDCYAILREDWQRPRRMEALPGEDAALVQALYRVFDEDTRLTASKAARVEFLTTVRTIEGYLRPRDRILDIGAGTGAYSLYFAGKGYGVSALELSERNLEVFRGKIKDGDPIDLVQGNALDLSRYADASFDIVLLFGPLYHLHSEEDRLRCIREAKRVCKPGGTLFFAFISNDIVILTMQQEDPGYLMAGAYDKESFRLQDVPFVFHTLEGCRELLRKGGIAIREEVAADGVSELLKGMINAMDEETYRQYLRYHFYLSRKPECLGLSNHLLFVGKKG